MKREVKLVATDPRLNRLLYDKPQSNVIREGNKWKQQSIRVVK